MRSAVCMDYSRLRQYSANSKPTCHVRVALRYFPLQEALQGCSSGALVGSKK